MVITLDDVDAEVSQYESHSRVPLRLPSYGSKERLRTRAPDPF